MSEPWIQSYTGRKVTPFDLQPDQVCLEDVAHALSLKARFSGHTAFHYSVAQHSFLGAKLLPPSYSLAFLLHDVSEAYLPDIPSPLKSRIKWCDGAGNPIRWDDLERKHAHVILTALGHSSLFNLIDSPEVRAMDLAMLLAEKAALLGTEPEPWGVPGTAALAQINKCDPLQVQSAFLDLYGELTKPAPQVWQAR